MITLGSARIDIDEIHARVYPADVLNLFHIMPEKSDKWNRQGGYKVHCPFHDDSDPSMHVYSNGVYCFGCGWCGDVIKLYMALANVDFMSALTSLSDLFSVPASQTLPASSLSLRNKAAPLSDCRGYWPPHDISLEQKCQEWHDVLMSAEGAQVRDYLLARCISEDAMQLWLLGYRRLPRPALTIPVHDADRRVVAVRFRALPWDTIPGPRYWGLKGRNDQYLFGWPLCKDAMHFWGDGFVFLLEGELDLIAFHAATGLPGLTITSGAISLAAWTRWKAYLEAFKLWIAAMDADPVLDDKQCPPGQKAVFDLMACYGPRVVAFRWPPPFGRDKEHKDITDLLINIGPDPIWCMVDKVIKQPFPALYCDELANLHYPRLYMCNGRRRRRNG